MNQLLRHFQPLCAALVLRGLANVAFAHAPGSDADHSLASLRPVPSQGLLVQVRPLGLQPPGSTGSVEGAQSARPVQTGVFDAFAPLVKTRWDERFLYVESNGMPAHGLMVGITAWQQQVPLPHAYSGDNAWRIPLNPVPAKEPRSIRNNFLRGAIALAANGIPIFNPQNNRGEIAQEIGELDQWGGHCGRADDYHYHAAPLHLQDVVGKGRPVAYALDGYPIYGLSEPDGRPVGKLDAFNGHDDPRLGYHYHASTKYPYVNGGFHGEVVEAGGQVDPQPVAGPMRGAGSPLRGARITGFERMGANGYKLSYEVNGDKRAILYSVNADGTFPFEYQNGREGTHKEVYTKRPGGDSAGNPRGGEDAGKRRGPNGLDTPDRRPGVAGGSLAIPASKPAGSFVLSSPALTGGNTLPVEFTGDGAGSTPPLVWSGAPPETKSYALIMHHLDPEGKTKVYWTLYNIPAALTQLGKNAQGIGSLGSNTVNNRAGYAPPHSKGPGAKTYVLTLYALSIPPPLSVPSGLLSGEALLATIRDRVLANTDLSVVYSREGASPEARPKGREERGDRPPPPPRDGQRPPPPR